MKRFWRWLLAIIRRGGTTTPGQPTPVPPSTPAPDTNLPHAAYVSVPKECADRGDEIWMRNWHGAQVRLSANDKKAIRGIEGEWFPLDADVVGDRVQVSTNELGDAIVVGYDFTSPRTGYRYHWLGLQEQYSAAPLRLGTPGVSITVPRAKLNEALRIHWATVEV